MKKILLLAYTNLNFGDDMFVYTICRAFPNQEFVLYADQSYRKIFDMIPNLTIAETGFVRKVYNKLMNKIPDLFRVNFNTVKFSAVVYVIGGLFDEDKTWEHLINKCGIKRLKNMMWKNSYDMNTPFFLLGCNVTRVSSENYIEQMEYLFDGLRDICFRDRYSYSYFSKLENTRYAPDIVFNYDCETNNKDDSILISVWGPLTRIKSFPQWQWAEELWSPYERFLIEIIIEFQKMGRKVTLLALCENEGDLDACNKIKMDGRMDVNIVTYRGNLDEIIELFEHAGFVVGTRFHSIVMALNAGCSFYPIIYESKTQQLLKDIGYCGSYSHIEQLETYIVESVLYNYKECVSIPCDMIKKKASEQFLVLRDYLGNMVVNT